MWSALKYHYCLTSLEETKGARKPPRNPPLYFDISCFTVSVLLSINSHKTASDFMILTISFIYLFEIYLAFKDKLFTNPGKLSLAKAMERLSLAMLVGFYLNYLTKIQKIHLVGLFTKLYTC